MNTTKRSPVFRIVAGLVALAAIVATAVIVGRSGSTKADGPDTPKYLSRNGNLYAGIPARIEFKPSDVALHISDNDRMAGAWKLLADVSGTFNAYDPASELGKLNAATSTDPVKISADMGSVLGMSAAVAQITRGAFDITIRPLKNLWKTATKTGVVPDDAARTQALERVGFSKLGMDRNADGTWNLTRKVPGMELDFGGIVKGWSVGRALDYLTASGVKSALVQVGGEIALSGSAPGGGPWRIGIKDPLKTDANWTVLSISGRAAVSTSGNYEQPVKIGNTDFYHIINPTTGQPVSTDILGVTVVVTSGPDMNAMADGLSTGLAVLGADEGLKLAEHMPGVDVLFIVKGPDGKPVEKATSGMKRFRN